MSPWLPLVGPAVATVALLLVPGLLIGYAAGLRGLVACGLAPALSITAIALGAVVGPLVRARLDWVLVLGMTLCLAAVACVLNRVLRRSRVPVTTERPAAVVAGVAGACLGAVPIILAVARGIGRPDRWPQTYDAVFHLNAVRQVLWTGNGSSLDLGTTGQPEKSHAFYPGAWHDLVALVVQLTGAELVTAVTAVSITLAAVAWPLGCVVLTRQLCGPTPGALFAAGLVSGGFAAAPYLLLSYGTLWPNALATVLLPGVLALLAVVLRLAPHGTVGPGRAVLAGLLIAPGCVLAHPNAAVTAVVYGSVMAAFALWHWAARGSDRRRVVAAGAALVALAGADILLLVSPLFRATRGTDWPARGTPAQALGEFVFGAPVSGPLPAVMAGLLLLGVWRALHLGTLRWLVACHAAAGLLYVAARASDSRWAQVLTGPWYNDSFRLAALGPVTGVPLAVIGLAWCVARLGALWRRRSGVLWRRRPVTLWGGAMVGLVLVTQGLSVHDNARVMATWYRSTNLLGAQETALLQRLPSIVPPRTAVAGNPWNGSALVQALAGRPATFPHLSGAWGADRELVASSLASAVGDAAVCRAARRLRVGYVLDGPPAFWPTDPRTRRYPGLAVGGHAGFEPVATGGRLTLYRLSAC
ncbi:MAG TPA: DUF6541 family protein [Intrasporangium sp.]|nr:DUF6541 family protein [Intrasporangium sp.]